MAGILLLYDSRGGLTEQLADSVERGITRRGRFLRETARGRSDGE